MKNLFLKRKSIKIILCFLVIFLVAVVVLPQPGLAESRKVKTETKMYYFHQDHLGGTAVITDDNGDLVKDYDYDPYGKTLHEESAADFEPTQGFTGKEEDKETDLQYFGARYYNSELGRFTQLDPLYLAIGTGQVKQITGKDQQEVLQNPQCLNSYSYTRNNPVNYIDPDGQDARVTINSKDNTVKIDTTIYIYGPDATDELAETMQNDIMNEWNGDGWTYLDQETGTEYSAEFDVKVKKTSFFGAIMNKTQYSNIIKIDTEKSIDRGGSYVNTGLGFYGMWRGNDPDPAPHEFGHLVCLDDRYAQGEGAIEGWEGNIMAERAMEGSVEQRNIDSIVSPYVKKHNKRYFKSINNVTVYRLKVKHDQLR